MDDLNLSEEQIEKLAKKDEKLLFEIQKEIHSQKEIHYHKLRQFYWLLSTLILVAFFFIIIYFHKGHLWAFFFPIAASVLLIAAGSKLYYIDKPAIIQKAFARSKKKHLDAIEFEIESPKDQTRRKFGLTFIILGCLIYLLAFTIIILC